MLVILKELFQTTAIIYFKINVTYIEEQIGEVKTFILFVELHKVHSYNLFLALQ